ncbi:MAG: HAD hydrolase-like protein [Deltaproteobacteria bacterium]|nr:HAD hydrolase-like protein [Deltaproteobacteria bacterium]
MNNSKMATKMYLVRTISDTVETDIQRVYVISNEVLVRYKKAPLSFEQLRKIADGPFDLFLIPLVFEKDYKRDYRTIFNEQKRQEIRDHALEIARKHGYDTDPPGLVPGIEDSLRATQEAGLGNILMTTGGRRYKHQAMENHGIGEYFEEIVDRDQTYFMKEQGIYHLFRQHQFKKLQVVLLTGTASYIRAGNNLEACTVGGNQLEVCTAALSTEYSYNDEETLISTGPKILIHGFGELIPKLIALGIMSEPGVRN